jgi:hypothetical protein
MPVSLNGTTGIVFNDASTQNTAATGFGFKNRIINGQMVLDQRNAGASVTPTDGQYLVDRWVYQTTQASKFTAQQDAGAVTPPAGFADYLGLTSTSAFTVGSSDVFLVSQFIEGFNTADLAWGTANASPVTLSFWVRSSLTGTFGGALLNSAQNRSYPFSYTISAANTWEQKSVTVVGDTSGTWLTTNGIGMRVRFGLGVGSTYSGTAGAWSGSALFAPTGATNVVSTSGATFYITGVQLEKGSTATSFDYRPYTTELLLCQRYFVRFGGEASAEVVAPSGIGSSTTSGQFYNLYPVRMRAIPTVAFNSLTLADTVNPAVAVTSIAFGTNVGSSQISSVSMNVASGVAANRPLYARTSGTDGFLSYSAEL